MKPMYRKVPFVIGIIIAICSQITCGLGIGFDHHSSPIIDRSVRKSHNRKQANGPMIQKTIMRQYLLLIDSLFKRMDKLTFLPMNQFEEVYLAYFGTLKNQQLIDSSVADNLYQLMIDFTSKHSALYKFDLLPKVILKHQLKKALFKPRYRPWFVNETPYIFIKRAPQLKKWLMTSNSGLDALFWSQESEFIYRSFELVSFVLNGLVGYAKRQFTKDQGLKWSTVVDDYLDRLYFLKLSTKSFNNYVKRLLDNLIGYEITADNFSESIGNLINLQKNSEGRKQWLENKENIEREFWYLAESKKSELVHFIDAQVYNNPQIVKPEFRTYYLLKLQKYMSKMRSGDRQSFVENPKLLFDLFSKQFFKSFDCVNYVANSFKYFNELLGIESYSLLLKSWKAYRYELTRARIVDSASERSLKLLVNDYVSSFEGKEAKTQNQIISPQNLSGSTQSIGIMTDQVNNKVNGGKRKLTGGFNRFVNNIFGLNTPSVSQLKLHTKIFWKRYLEFYNLRKPGVFSFHMNNILRIIKPHSKMRGFYNLKYLLSHYSDSMENIKLLKPPEKKYLIRGMLHLILGGYTTKGVFNLKIALKHYKDNTQTNLKQILRVIHSQTKAFSPSIDSRSSSRNTYNGFIERIADYRRAQIKLFKKLDAKTFLKSNYKYRTNLNKAIDEIVERIRDSNIHRLPLKADDVNSKLWSSLFTNVLSQKQHQDVKLPVLERTVDYKSILQPTFGLSFVECFRQHFKDLKFRSWSSLQSALRNYVSDIRGLYLKTDEIMLLQQAIRGLRPFYSDGSIDFSKFMANYPEQVEIVNNFQNPKLSVLELFKTLNHMGIGKLIGYWSRFIDLAASFYPQEEFDLIKSFVVKYFLCLSKHDQSASISANSLFAGISDEILNPNDFECDPSINGEKKKILRQFYLNTRFEFISKAKSILATAKHIYTYKSEELENMFNANKIVFDELLGQEVSNDIQALLSKYNTLVATANLSIFRRSDQPQIIEQLKDAKTENPNSKQILINLFNRFSETLLLFEPLTSLELKSSLKDNLHFCSHSTKSLNILFESIKVNEKLGERKSVLNFAKQYRFDTKQTSQNFKQMYNIYKVLYHLKLSGANKFSTFIKILKNLIELLQESPNVPVIRKNLFKFVTNEQKQFDILRKEDLVKIIESDDKNGFDMASIKKNLLKYIQQRISFLKTISTISPAIFRESCRSMMPLIRIRSFKFLSKDILSKLSALKTPHIFVAAQKYGNAFDQSKSKLYKFVNGDKISSTIVKRNKDIAFDNIQSNNKEAKAVGFKAQYSKYVDGRKHILSVFNKRNFASLLNKKAEEAKISSLKSKAYKFMTNSKSSLLTKTSQMEKINSDNSNRQSNIQLMRSQVMKAMFQQELKSLLRSSNSQSVHSNLSSANQWESLKSHMIKSVLSDNVQQINSMKQNQLKSMINRLKSNGQILGSTFLKQTLFQKVFVSYMKSKVNTATIDKVKSDAILRSIMFNKVMDNPEHKMQFLKFALDYIKRQALFRPKVSGISQKIVFKLLDSLYVEQQFLRYVREVYSDKLASKLLKLRSIGNERIKLNRIIKIFKDENLEFKRKNNRLKPIEKLKTMIHDFRKVFNDMGGAGNRMGIGSSSMSLEKAVHRMSKLINDANDLGKVYAGANPKTDIICCSCCYSNEGDCQNSGMSNCDCNKAQRDVSADDSFIQRADKMINIDPIVNIHIRIRDKNGQYVDQETFTLNDERSLEDKASRPKEQLITSTSARII